MSKPVLNSCTAMAQYCVNRNAQPNGDHEVHNLDAACPTLPEHNNRLLLGEHPHCHSAVLKAKLYFNQVNGCANCAKECHTG